MRPLLAALDPPCHLFLLSCTDTLLLHLHILQVKLALGLFLVDSYDNACLLLLANGLRPLKSHADQIVAS